MSNILCKFCPKVFTSHKVLLEHFLDDHLSEVDSFPCIFCEKSLVTFDDLMHHMNLDHKGIDSKILSSATLARETKKQLGDYVDMDKKGATVECNFCFEMFPNLDTLNEHGKNEHGHELNPEFIEKMKNAIDLEKQHPICEMCNHKFLGVIFTKIDNKIQNVCFNCYEKYFGENALARLTIGTNENMIAKLRKPLS